MLSRKQQFILVVAILFIFLVPFVLMQGSETEEIFLGADEQVSGIVAEIAPDYLPWFQPLFEPPSTEIQSLLFSLQAAIGAGVLGYYLGSRKRTSKDESQC